MITLTIKKADGSIYWVEHFNDQASCDVWLATEKTRPYWQKSFVATWVASPIPDKPDAATVAASLAKQAAAIDTLKAFNSAKALPADVASAIDAILIVQGIK